MSEKETIRCAIYTRKSTEEGLEQDFNSLDAQREAGEAYVASQKEEGWVCLGDRYDDGGFTGGNMDRPAFQRLMADVAEGRIDCIVVYKVDRLSRSLLDFARIMEALDKNGVSLVSVTQQFNTTTSMGRLTLNILLSFAQFEREIISERTRDKIAAARRKGKWSGGRPILGYDVDPRGGRLLVNEDEAARVQAIFELYLEQEALLPVVRELDARGWTNKCWTNKKHRESGGSPFNKVSLSYMLRNVLYIGKLTYGKEVHEGEHPAILDAEVFEQVQALLHRNGTTGGRCVRNKFGALLKGLVRCVPCGCAMIHTHTKKGNKRYRYYVCLNAQKRGWHNCPSKSVPAAEMERFVVDQIRSVGKDHVLQAETFKQARALGEKRTHELEAEKASLERELKRHAAALRKLVSQVDAADRIADIQERIRAAEQRATQVREELIAVGRELVDEREVARALEIFDPVWESLSTREKERAIRLLVERVDYDGAKGTLSVIFHPAGMKLLAQNSKKEVRA